MCIYAFRLVKILRFFSRRTLKHADFSSDGISLDTFFDILNGSPPTPFFPLFSLGRHYFLHSKNAQSRPKIVGFCLSTVFFYVKTENKWRRYTGFIFVGFRGKTRPIQYSAKNSYFDCNDLPLPSVCKFKLKWSTPGAFFFSSFFRENYSASW